MNSKNVRNTFLNYFEKHQHSIVRSSSLVPEGDATLLFTNAGMNQFKNVFLGLEKRPYSRAVTSQKCVRAGGKHNDLENVGHTARHHTFFEMLGNFSFGDYFKEEAIHYAWDFLTNELKLPKEKLYVTVFQSDDEAADIWHKQESVPRERISRFGEKDNFWRMGDTGPCGPCSEIFYDHGPKGQHNCPDKQNCKVGCECDRFVEIWNLVFMQYMEEPKGTLTPLPKPSVDTGMGLERLTAVLNNTHINYDTDLFLEIIAVAEKLTKTAYGSSEKTDAAMRVLSDHARATAFLIADGVLPANDGRGYVLRRILRRAIRYGRTLNQEVSIFPSMVEKVISKMSEFYPELEKQKILILKSVESEEERFLTTLDQGTQLLNKLMGDLRKENKETIPGESIFKLYDTYGFPSDLTRLMAAEENFNIDEEGFEIAMEKAKNLARASWKGQALSKDLAHILDLSQALKDTKFTGYSSLVGKAKILSLSNGSKEVEQLSEGEFGLVVLNETPFYAEGGGQVGDQGSFKFSGGFGEVLDCTKQANCHFHQIKILQGNLKAGEELTLEVTSSIRRRIMANHSATHLMHAALRRTLGDHVTQAGSLVEAERLRFDYTHNKALEDSDIENIETLVNSEISKSIAVSHQNMTYDKAMESGALALFGEKYGDEVRVIQMGQFSTELCGGTHVQNTSDIRLFKIVSETGVSSGVRRIEALTGDYAIEFLLKQSKETKEARNEIGIKENWAQYFGLEERKNKLNFDSVADWIKANKEQVKALEKEIKSLKINQIDYKKIVETAKESNSIKLIFLSLPIDDRKLIADISEKIRDHAPKSILVCVGESEQNFPVLVSCTKNISGSIVHSGELLKEITQKFGGKGGGKPDSAQGAVDKVPTEAEILDILESFVKAKF